MWFVCYCWWLAVPFPFIRRVTARTNGTRRDTETFFSTMFFARKPFSLFFSRRPTTTTKILFCFPSEFWLFQRWTLANQCRGVKLLFPFSLPFGNENDLSLSQLRDGVEMSKTCSPYSFPRVWDNVILRLASATIAQRWHVGRFFPCTINSSSSSSDCNRVNDAKANWQLKYLPLWNSLALV